MRRTYNNIEEAFEAVKRIDGKAGIHVEHNVNANLFFSELLERMSFDMCHRGHRFNYMNAEIFEDRTLVSYSTPCAILYGNLVIEFGVYSSTTSKQVSKWAESCGISEIIRVKSLNLYDYNHSKLEEKATELFEKGVE